MRFSKNEWLATVLVQIPPEVELWREAVVVPPPSILCTPFLNGPNGIFGNFRLDLVCLLSLKSVLCPQNETLNAPIDRIFGYSEFGD